MEIVVKSSSIDKLRDDCIVIPVHTGVTLSESAKSIDQISDGYIHKILKKGDIDAEHGQLQWLHKHNVPAVAT